jgi:hypothetical protein
MREHWESDSIIEDFSCLSARDFNRADSMDLALACMIESTRWKMGVLLDCFCFATSWGFLEACSLCIFLSRSADTLSLASWPYFSSRSASCVLLRLVSRADETEVSALYRAALDGFFRGVCEGGLLAFLRRKGVRGLGLSWGFLGLEGRSDRRVGCDVSVRSLAKVKLSFKMGSGGGVG